MIILKLNKNLSGLQRWKASGILKYWKIGTPHEYNSLLHAGEEELQPGEMAERIAEAWRLNRFLWDMLEHVYSRGTCSWRGEEGRLLTFVLTEAECRLWHEVMFWVFSGDRTFTIMATSIWNGYVSIWGLCLCTLYSKRYRLSSFDPSIYLATHHSLFVPGISAFHIKRQQFLAERTLPVRKMTPLLPQVLPPTSLGQPSSCEKGGVSLLRKERQLQRSGGRKGLSYQACNQGESFHP